MQTLLTAQPTPARPRETKSSDARKERFPVTTQSNSPTNHRTIVTTTLILALVAVWLLAVLVAAGSGWLSAIYPPAIAGLVALGIAIPTLAYSVLPHLQFYFRNTGLFPISIIHIWRIPAALMFFWFGAQGLLPTAFWVLAGVGDLLAGLFALTLARGYPSRSHYLAFHLFGFADFIVAVGTGLTFTLLNDPRMAPIAQLPLALIPFFGVGISGATHLIAFDMLRKQRVQANNP